jgi:hypothetical protein
LNLRRSGRFPGMKFTCLRLLTILRNPFTAIASSEEDDRLLA